jgi:hypothetical protein
MLAPFITAAAIDAIEPYILRSSGAASPASSARMRPMNDFLEVPIKMGRSENAALKQVQLVDQFNILFLTLSEANSRIYRD